MSLIFTPIFDETFSGPDSNPIDPAKWTPAQAGQLQQLKHFLCSGVEGSVCTSNYTAVMLLSDQYVDVHIHNLDNQTDCEIILRSDALQNNCYVLYVDGLGNGTADSAIVSYVDNNPTEILDFGTIPFSNGDVIRFAAVGTALYGYKNGVLLGSVNNVDHASGLTGFFLGSPTIPAIQISRYIGGKVEEVQGPYLGRVRVVLSAPAGDTDPFLGSVTVIGSAPANDKDPYLGQVRQVLIAPPGNTNPSLGSVTVVNSAPAGNTDSYLGQVEV